MTQIATIILVSLLLLGGIGPSLAATDEEITAMADKAAAMYLADNKALEAREKSDSEQFEQYRLDQLNVFERTVNRCIEKGNHDNLFPSLAVFDAYLDGDEVRMYGTKEDQFKFRKCMSQAGHSLGDK